MYWTSNATQCHPFDSGALAKLDLSNNYHSGDTSNSGKGSEEFIRPIASMLKTNPSIKEINLAGNNLNAEAGRIFSQDIHDNGALASLDLSNNITGAHGQREGVTALSVALKANTTITSLNIASNYLGVAVENVVTLSDAIQDMGALASLNISDNRISSDQQANIRKICAEKSIKCTL